MEVLNEYNNMIGAFATGTGGDPPAHADILNVLSRAVKLKYTTFSSPIMAETLVMSIQGQIVFHSQKAIVESWDCIKTTMGTSVFYPGLNVSGFSQILKRLLECSISGFMYCIRNGNRIEAVLVPEFMDNLSKIRQSLKILIQSTTSNSKFSTDFWPEIQADIKKTKPGPSVIMWDMSSCGLSSLRQDRDDTLSIFHMTDHYLENFMDAMALLKICEDKMDPQQYVKTFLDKIQILSKKKYHKSIVNLLRSGLKELGQRSQDVEKIVKFYSVLE